MSSRRQRRQFQRANRFIAPVAAIDRFKRDAVPGESPLFRTFDPQTHLPEFPTAVYGVTQPEHRLFPALFLISPRLPRHDGARRQAEALAQFGIKQQDIRFRLPFSAGERPAGVIQHQQIFFRKLVSEWSAPGNSRQLSDPARRL